MSGGTGSLFDMTPIVAPVRAISLWQPWASAYVSPLKWHETRHWPTDYRGPLVVHASKTKSGLREVEANNPGLVEALVDEFGPHWGMELPFGALVGIVQLVDCRLVGGPGVEPVDQTDCLAGNWGPGRYVWRREAFRAFPTPIPWVGRQGFFSIPRSALPFVDAR